ncbi:peptidoglycan editing factor PgeF [Granulicella sibirica]|uniref:Purine nucleoside phosphorylase n=1 Tax=Granulicella sibirica TaxID=2479048 RepID=A0A4Q0SZB1_9BACT|nr:peptidoglycan editing factor PgeF [Granulicella sibirica]RXH56207.1 hypothetical protein GRAN_3064 [Granulicella sibirica]
MHSKEQLFAESGSLLAHPPDLLRAPSFSAVSWLRHSFSGRQGGGTTVYGRAEDLNLGFTKEDDRAIVSANRLRLIAATADDEAGISWAFAHSRQIHSDTILTLRAGSLDPAEPADGLLTDVPGVFLAMLTADCVPVLLVDVRLKAVGVFHAGWRGTVAGIVRKGVARMQEEYGSNPADILAAVGPSVGPCCYEVGEEVRTRFDESFAYAVDLFDGANLNLWEANRQQLLAAGVPAANITVLAQCTACTHHEGISRFFSHRADKGVTGRMMALIGIVPDALPSEIE